MFENIFVPGLIPQIITIIFGIIVLVAGRKLFWLTVAAVGFITGLILAFNFLQLDPPWLAWVIAIVIGVVGAIVAIFLQKIAIGTAGFLMGGYALVWLLQFFNVELGGWQWIAFIVGAVIGLILVSELFEVALIGLSAIAGASLIVGVTNFRWLITVILFLVLVLVGIAIQARGLDDEATGG